MGSGRSGSPGGGAVPLSGEPFSVNACPAPPTCVANKAMDDGGLSSSFDRAERALQRIERALGERRPGAARDEELRARVREVVEELDELIREAAA